MPTDTTVTRQIIDPTEEDVAELPNAIEGDLVHIAGPETITGLKTFTQSVTAPEFIGNVRGGISDGVLLGNLDLNGFELVGFTGSEFLLRSESSAAGRSILDVNTPDFNSYLKVTDLGAAVLESPAQVLIDINAEPSLGNPSSDGYVLSSTAAGARSWVAQAAGGGSVATDTIWDAKGDLAVGTGANTAAKLAVGANDTILIADSTQTTGIRWGTPASIRTALDLEIGTDVQAFDNDLTTWAAVTRASGFDTFVATPNSVNLRALVTGDTGTGGLFFSNGNIGIATGTSLTLTSNIEAANLLANASNFDLVNTTATTVNFAGAATVLNIGSAASGVTTLNSPTVSLAGTLLQPVTSYNTNIGSLSKKFLAIHAAELWVETLVAQDTMAIMGGRALIGPSTTSLIADLSTGATTIDIKHNSLASGDTIYMESSAKVEFMAVTSGATVITGGFRYSVTRNLDGTGANEWFAGDAVFNTGQAGSGFIDLYAVRGVKAITEAGPTIVGNVRNSSTYNDWSARWAIGNLKGLYDYGTTLFGAAFGRYATAGQTWVSVDETNGFRINNNATNVGQWYGNGDIRIGQTTGNLGNVFITAAGVLSIRRGTTDYITLSATDAQFINLIKMTGASAAMSLGTTPPSSATVGTGIWLDRTGLYALSANIQNATLTPNGLTSGSGSIVINNSGLDFTVSTSTGTTDALSWTREGTFDRLGVQQVVNQTTGVHQVTWQVNAKVPSNDSTSIATSRILSTNNNTLAAGQIAINSVGTTASVNASKSYALIGDYLGNSTFLGLTLGSASVPTHMLDVYGTGWFQSHLTVEGASAASTPGQIWAGAWFTGGSGTTTMPHLLIRATGTTAATTWSTAGTAFGINAVTGFTGDFLNFKLAGAADSAFRVSSTGAVTSAASVVAGAGSSLVISGKLLINSSVDGVTRISNAAGTDYDRLQLGGTTSSFPAIKRSTTGLQARLADDSAFTSFTASSFIIGTASTGWAETNVTPDKVFDADTVTTPELADVVGTLIARLRVALPGLVNA